jgi:hypothetical protein
MTASTNAHAARRRAFQPATAAAPAVDGLDTGGVTWAAHAADAIVERLSQKLRTAVGAGTNDVAAEAAALDEDTVGAECVCVGGVECIAFASRYANMFLTNDAATRRVVASSVPADALDGLDATAAPVPAATLED